MSSNIKGNISKEVTDILIELMKNIIGTKTVTLILTKLEAEEKAKGKDIIYAFAESTANILSKKASFSILRQVGRDLAASIISTHDSCEWEKALQETLNHLGFAQKIIKDDDKAFICDCVFYNMLQKNNLNPTEHPVCWTGWGFIEGFMRELKNVKSIQWVNRDLKNKRCQFDYIK